MRNPNYGIRLAEAVVQEIWNEMGRQRITSLRELARRAHMTHTSINVRMNGDARTGKPVVLNVRDLAAIGGALGVMPAELLARAQAAAGSHSEELPPQDANQAEDAKVLSAVELLDANARKTRKAKKADMSSFEGSDKAARTEDDEKPRLD